ncbi:alkaline phosphatase D family protein [Pleomorphovibrio marinus]|uniref:alkaline phosphatase D family protein n=1 Tax=Pleomorphovibrio marinus TaxID=2164132 RepID=UPI000E0AA7BD|nr:alkaline phosphatase D family protein [Pleomorphovibrio marinus]
MNTYTFTIWLIGLLLVFSCNQKVENGLVAEEEAGISVIAFGSCNRHNLPQPLWQPILEENPDLWIWLGDNVYGDTHDMELLASKYKSQYEHEEYKKVREQVEVIGIWDDHDYGINDGGFQYAKKDESQQLMLDFLDEPEDSPRRDQKGAYASYTYGSGDQKIKVFLLDARYHRDTIYKKDNAYQPNLEGTILGEEQWEWLEKEFKNSDASIHIIASGIQIIAEEHGSEKWANFPKEREKLFNLIVDTGIQNPILLSGDRHIAEISRKTLSNGYDLYDITSSGLTHTWDKWRPEANKHRIGEHIAELHYAVFHIDWENRSIAVGIRGEEQKEFLAHEIGF